VALWCAFDIDETVKLTRSKITDLSKLSKIATAHIQKLFSNLLENFKLRKQPER